MRIGQDVSIQVCRDEGYMVMDYLVRKLFPNGKKQPLNKDYQCTFTKSLPDHCRGGYVGEQIIILEEDYSWNDLWEMYVVNKTGVDSMIGGHFEDTEHIEVSQLLNLADSLDAYCGISTGWL